MSHWIIGLALLVSCCQVLIVWGIKTNAAERAALIDAAISEAKEQASQAHVKFESNKSITLQRHRAFKLAYPETLAQGKARLLYEDMVHRAEKKILASRRIVNSASLEKDTEAMAEALATELLHTPGSLLTKEEIAKMYEASECAETVHTPDCSNQKIYRTADGTCNNRNNPTYGAANTPYERLILPQYEDGISTPRGWLQSTGSSLYAGPFSPPNPSPRVVSTGVITRDLESGSPYTHILMQWGQFMDHDLDLAPEFEQEDCPDGCYTNNVLQCAPFPVPYNDNSVKKTQIYPQTYGCHAFKRSVPACEKDTPTEMNPREQVNSISSFIDGSQVYHHDVTVQNNLIRDKSKGKGQLKTGSPVPGTTKPTLPFVNQEKVVGCPEPLKTSECYLGGDQRVNEQTALTVMHTIWMREHNRIATELSVLNPEWDEETLFQEARQIIIAQIQKITYKDYLPLVIGDFLPTLLPEYNNYDDQVNPNIPNAFAAAAYRFGHSQVFPLFDRLDENYVHLPQGPLSLVDAFFTPSRFVESGGTDPILRGLVTVPAQPVDEFISDILTSRLFTTDKFLPGLDLASLNIQRGRDHGLPPYPIWKRWALEQCGFETDFRNELTKTRLLETYGTLETVDLFVGGLAEVPLQGGLVGPTFACIFAKTFQAVRDGDRFYYENADAITGIFTARQRAEIEKASLSRIICDDSDNIQRIQPNAFRNDQLRVPCYQLPQIDLSAWQTYTCYMRIGIRGNTLSEIPHTITALNRYMYEQPVYYNVTKVRIDREDAFDCLSIIQCSMRNPSTSMIYAYTPDRSCTLLPNLGLPPTLHPLYSHIYYTESLTRSYASESNGIYLTKARCIAGTVNALGYACGSLKANKQNEDEKLVQSLEQMQQDSGSDPSPTEEPPSRIDKDIQPDDPIFKNAPEEVRNFLPSLFPSSGGNEKLMENILQELKAQNKKNHG